jgi:hypothetical protein
MDTTRSSRAEHTAGHDFLIRLAIALVMLYGFLVTVSLLPTDLP